MVKTSAGLAANGGTMTPDWNVVILVGSDFRTIINYLFTVISFSRKEFLKCDSRVTLFNTSLNTEPELMTLVPPNPGINGSHDAPTHLSTELLVW